MIMQVVWQVIENLQQKKDLSNLRIKIVFFDLEDGLAYLDGSNYYVKHNDLSNISFVLNIDTVGVGDSLLLHPDIASYAQNEYLDHLIKSVTAREIQYFSMKKPLFSGIADHMPFLKFGIPAFTVIQVPESDIEYLKNTITASTFAKIKSLFTILFNRKSHPMYFVSHRHNELDTSEFIDQKSLNLCEEVVMNLISFHLGVRLNVE